MSFPLVEVFTIKKGKQHNRICPALREIQPSSDVQSLLWDDACRQGSAAALRRVAEYAAPKHDIITCTINCRCSHSKSRCQTAALPTQAQQSTEPQERLAAPRQAATKASRAEAACASERAIYEAKLQQLLTTMLATRALAPQRLHNKAENLHDKLVTAAQPAAEPQAAAA